MNINSLKLLLSRSDRCGDSPKATLCDRGFTLVELLIALAIMGIVITLTGSGLYALMMVNHRSQIETAERLELEQAVAFVTDEIKMSQKIETAIPTPISSITGFRSASGSSRIQPILVLTPAATSGLTNPIVYYLADPPNTSVWLGPRVIYRWGPTLLQNGNYSDGNGNDVSQIARGSAVNYYNEVLIDRLSDIAPTQANITCDSNYNNSIPNLTDRLGFYACVAPDQKSVKFWMHKQLTPDSKSQSIDALVVTRSN